MKRFHYALGIIFSISLIIILLITSIEAVLYWTPGYFEKEYNKYEVKETINMEMEDLLEVTDVMMDYLRGDREDLQVVTRVDGTLKPFFNQRELAHMIDVKHLFLAGLALRRVGLVIAAASLALLYFCKGKWSKVLPEAICMGTGLFFAAACILAVVVSTDFTKYFTIFHEIFFDNDLWILNPDTDLLINIVPEPFFIDTVFRIAVVFGGSILLLLLASVFWLRRQGKGRNRRLDKSKGEAV